MSLFLLLHSLVARLVEVKCAGGKEEAEALMSFEHEIVLLKRKEEAGGKGPPSPPAAWIVVHHHQTVDGSVGISPECCTADELTYWADKLIADLERVKSQARELFDRR